MKTFFLIIGLIIAVFMSLLLGFVKTNFSDLYGAIYQFNDSQTHIILIHSRVPRTINSLLNGAALGASGILLQTLTRNRLASSSILGINSGASLLLVIALFLMPQSPWSRLYWFAFLGAFLASILVYSISGGLSSKGNASDLVLGGIAISALLFSLTQAFLYRNNAALEEVLFWMTGSVDGKKLETIAQLAPFIMIGLVLALLFSKKLDTFSLGDEMASSLGMNVVRFKVIIMLITTLLCAASVALAGPISFVCLIAPYIARHFYPTSYTKIVPASMLIGALMLVLSDVLARFIIYPKELSVGSVTALFGGVFFIYLFVKREKRYE